MFLTVRALKLINLIKYSNWPMLSRVNEKNILHCSSDKQTAFIHKVQRKNYKNTKKIK